MSRLNSSIKMIVFLGNLFFLLLSCTLAVLSGLIIYEKAIIEISIDAIKQISYYIGFISLFIFIFTCLFGCCGAVNQVVRKGICAGRRILCIHQFLLIALLVLSINRYHMLQMRETSLEIVLSDIASYPKYDSFEKRISNHFNIYYFQYNCMLDNPLEQSYFLRWIEQECPLTMSHRNCYAFSTKKKDNVFFNTNNNQGDICDTRCEVSFWSKDVCCPDELLCRSSKNNERNVKACPYDQCRFAILKTANKWIRPIKTFFYFTIYLAGIMIILTCLLICYNPRDNVEQELLKAGALDKEDIESLRSMRSLVDSVNSLSHSPSSKSMRGSNFSPPPKSKKQLSSIGKSKKSLVAGSSRNVSPVMSQKQLSSTSMMRRPSRRSNRISPTPSDSDTK